MCAYSGMYVHVLLYLMFFFSVDKFLKWCTALEERLFDVSQGQITIEIQPRGWLYG